MRLTPETVHEEYEWVQERADDVVPLINETRAYLGSQFDVDVDTLTDDAYTAAIDEVFADGDRAVNVAALVRLLRELDVTGDYPGFVIDELLGRELAAMIAGEQPLRLLAEATFHVADLRTHGDDTATAGADDLDAALAAGVQTRVPGWPWQQTESPFAVE
ncbi:hypothetical protein [Haloarcula argentinensis]|uniref:DUF7984 domain-containing protein n=1 Tax=Haloarcula argentinensis TaxID=43776 RepID=A0ABU2EWV1_HALAR|nr:hypothetical protein [Haloarcula argentinensis]EMA23652.1 hypothetical protein C443_08308 [Haloarcula argentinensis DSM 12282]MDS0252742.1 hypothetical protein [Haloarcula argentinensis]